MEKLSDQCATRKSRVLVDEVSRHCDILGRLEQNRCGDQTALGGERNAEHFWWFGIRGHMLKKVGRKTVNFMNNFHAKVARRIPPSTFQMPLPQELAPQMEGKLRLTPDLTKKLDPQRWQTQTWISRPGAETTRVHGVILMAHAATGASSTVCEAEEMEEDEGST